MTSPATYLCVIPARGGSKGVPGKNLRKVAGRPLLAWSIDHALSAHDVPMRVVVSTDDDAIREVAIAQGAEAPFKRPAALATDTSPTEVAVAHALESLRSLDGYDPSAVMILQPTSPVRGSEAVTRAVTRFEETCADTLVSVADLHPFTWRNVDDAVPDYDPRQRPMRQDFAPGDHRYIENGSIYLTRVSAFERSGCRISGRTVLFPMTKLESIDVDTEDDLVLADAILRSEAAP